MTTSKHHPVYVSDRAYASLVEQAYALNYVRSGIIARGIHHYIKALVAPHITYEDARPDYMLETEQWCTGVDGPVMRRLVRIDLETAIRYQAVALKFSIAGYRSQRVILNGVNSYVTHESAFYNPWPLIGPVLEAIGIGWLKPLGIDRAPADLWSMDERSWKKQTNYRKRQRQPWRGY